MIVRFLDFDGVEHLKFLEKSHNYHSNDSNKNVKNDNYNDGNILGFDDIAS